MSYINEHPAEPDDISICLVQPYERNSIDLQAVLNESFEGWYLRHALAKLRELKLVFSVTYRGKQAGLAMLDEPNPVSIYVFYIAVKKEFRRNRIASKLLDFCISYSFSRKKGVMFAAVEKLNLPSKKLFESKGFERIKFSQMVGLFGFSEAINMYRRMVVVPGEILLMRRL